jgi:hypothetical protein
VHGVVKKKMKARNLHKVLHDGDTSEMKPSGSHLQAATALDDASDSSDDEADDAANSDKDEAAMEDDDGLAAGPGGGSMSAYEIAAEEETAHLAPGGGHVSEDNSEAGDPAPQDPSHEGGKATTSCHEWEWKAATNMPDQRQRKGRPTGKFFFRNRARNIRGACAPVVDGTSGPPSRQRRTQQGPQHAHPE